MRESIIKRLSEIPGVASGPSRVGNSAHLAWFISGREFAHLHGDQLLDIRLPKQHQKEIETDDRAIFRKRRSAWVEFSVRSEDDLAEAIRLLELAAEAAR